MLGEQYGRVCRIAHALGTRPMVARKIVKHVMRVSAQFIPQWESDLEADNWFLRYTILTMRQTVGSASPRQENDYLVQHAPDAGPAYLAFVRAFRLLPSQQREAFLLSRGERLESRQLAIAMDCSTTAAGNHLTAATEALQKIAGDGFEAQATAIAGVYASLTPPQDLVQREVAAVSGKIRGRRWRKKVITVLEVIVLILLAWTIWRISRMIVI
jgi:sigma-70-like protein